MNSRVLRQNLYDVKIKKKNKEPVSLTGHYFFGVFDGGYLAYQTFINLRGKKHSGFYGLLDYTVLAKIFRYLINT